LALVLALALGFASGTANAGTKAFKCSTSGSFADIPIDLDSDSCFPAANGATVCTDYSSYNNYSFFCSPGGRSTGQNILEYDPLPGSGCNIVGIGAVPIAGCTLADSSEQGCALQS